MKLTELKEMLTDKLFTGQRLDDTGLYYYGARYYNAEEKRLVQLFRYGEINQDSILDEMNNLKKEIESDRQKLDDLVKTKEKIAKLKKAEVKLSKYCNLLKDRLDSASIQEKRDTLDMLAMKVTATTGAINIEGIILLKTIPSGFKIASVEPTHHCTNMASLFHCRYSYIEGSGYKLAHI